MTNVQCLNCKTMFDVEKGEEMSVNCPVCGSHNLRWIIGSFLDPASIREVRVRRVIPDD